MPSVTRAVAALLMVLVLVACGGAEPAPQPSPEPTAAGTDRPATDPPRATDAPEQPAVELSEIAVALEPVAQLNAPTAMAARPGDDRLYIAERGGVVRSVEGGNVGDTPVLDISGQVSTGGERGLLGLTFSADGDEL
jgi:glucose/arabinose dehydrogenase